MSRQYINKIVNNTGFNWDWGRAICINRPNFTTLNQEKRFDSGRDYQNVNVMLLRAIDTVDPGLIAAGWHLDMQDSGSGVGHNFDISGMKLTTTYQTVAFTSPATPVFDIKADASGNGFILKVTADPSPGSQYIWGFMWRLEDGVVDSGTDV